MAGRVSGPDATAARVGASIEQEARSTRRPLPPVAEPDEHGLLGRIRAALAA
jgi:hypothetical protein